jgi:hypothetical protein
MSRGLGRVQRAILGYMVADRRRPWSANELAERILGSASTSAQFSIRRALANLGAAGTIVELPSDTAIKFWRMAANERHPPGRDNRKRKEEQRRREKDLRQARPDKLAKMLGILGSDHEGHVLLGAGQANRQPIGDTLIGKISS